MEGIKEQPKVAEVVQEEQEQQEEITGKNKTNLNERLINCTKKAEYEEVQRCLKKKADVNYQENTKKKWTAFIWACCLGNKRLVKLLMSKGAAENYLELKLQHRLVVLGSTKQMRVNPLHWASFKGHLDVVCVLIKTGLHWQDVDSCGNNSVMLSAAGNYFDIFTNYLQIGVSLQCKNARGHTVKDLTTNQSIIELVNKCQQTKQCAVSKIPFKEQQIKYWCWVCGEFVNQKNYHYLWVLNQLNSPEKQKIDGRCEQCWKKMHKIQNQFEQAIQAYDEQKFKQIIKKYKKEEKQIQITFMEKCHKICHKITVQNEILAYLKKMSKVEDYKIILKSVNKIRKMLKDVQQIHIDQNVIDQAEKQIQRLNAERNLRYQIDNIDTSVATRQGVGKLQDVFSQAEEKNVSQDYLSVAGDIKQKMTKSIMAQDLFKMFVQYPQRPDPYPDPLVIDFKTKKPLDPATKKPTDPNNLLPKKKKGKKGPQFTIPDWAIDIKDMNEKIKEQEDLLLRRQELGLSKEFCQDAEGKIVLMKRQSRYRKDMDTLQTMVDELNKKKK